ncbi:MAG: hypothetical protein ACREPE_10080, partial [Lysobacter sp.]
AESSLDSRAGVVSGGSRHLFNWLTDNYQVDVVEADGGLYAKQGSSFPIRIVVVGKKGRNPTEILDQLQVIEDHEQLIDWARSTREKYSPDPALEVVLRPDDVVFDAADVIAFTGASGHAADGFGKADEGEIEFDAMALDLPDARALPSVAVVATPAVAPAQVVEQHGPTLLPLTRTATSHPTSRKAKWARPGR